MAGKKENKEIECRAMHDKSLEEGMNNRVPSTGEHVNRLLNDLT